MSVHVRVRGGAEARALGRQRADRRRPGARRPAPLAVAMGAVRLTPAGGVGAARPSARRLRAVSRADPTNGQAPTECWLTRREMQVLRLLATGRTYREIAGELLLSEETIRSHLKHIPRKLDAPDRSQAVACAVRAGILPS